MECFEDGVERWLRQEIGVEEQRTLGQVVGAAELGEVLAVVPAVGIGEAPGDQGYDRLLVEGDGKEALVDVSDLSVACLRLGR